MKAIITFLLIFCVIVVFHEFGHFFFAKRSVFVDKILVCVRSKVISFRREESLAFLCHRPLKNNSNGPFYRHQSYTTRFHRFYKQLCQGIVEQQKTCRGNGDFGYRTKQRQRANGEWLSW